MGEPAVPPSVLRSWDEAEARLFPLVMAQPELYQQALGAIQALLGPLRETCPDLAALLAAHERGGDLVGVPVPGVRPALIAAAACAMRYRELVALLAARGRLAALARAREAGESWAVVEESGPADRAPYVPYQRVDRGRQRPGGHRLHRPGRDAEPGRLPPGRGPGRRRVRRPADRRPVRQLPRPRRVRGRPPPGPRLTPDAGGSRCWRARGLRGCCGRVSVVLIAAAYPRGCLDVASGFIKDGKRTYRIT